MAQNGVQDLPQAQASDFAGYRPIRVDFDDPKFVAKVNNAVEIIYNTPRLSPQARMLKLVQAMSTADFPYLTGAIIERELLAGFNYPQQTIEPIFRKATRLNFNTKRAMRLDGGDQQLVEVKEDGSYAVGKVSELEAEYALKLYGRVIPLTLQMLANDDLNAFAQIPGAMGRGARLTRQKNMTSLLMTTTGWKTTLVGTTGWLKGGQASVSNLPLTPENLQTALTEFLLFEDAGDNPIMARPRYLVVNPTLTRTAAEITQAESLATIVTGLASTSSKTTQITTAINWIRSFGLTPLVDPWIPSVATSGTIGATAWGLFSDPADIPAAEWGVWAPAPEPQVFVKTPDQTPVTGGADPYGTSFDPESKIYKVRDAHGGVALMSQGRWLSNGQ
jgi:hypothetical protein